jgi:hypothetical protein
LDILQIKAANSPLAKAQYNMNSMPIIPRFLPITASIFLFVFLCQVAKAALPFSINAAVNGFEGWTEINTSEIDNLNGRRLQPSGTTMDTSGVSWLLFANDRDSSGGHTSSNIYSFGSSLPVGGYVEIDISLGDIDTGGVVGFGLQNISSVNRFETFYIGSDTVDSFKLIDVGGTKNLTGADTSFGSSAWKNGAFQKVRFTLGENDSYTLTFDGEQVSNSGLALAASDISQIRIFNFNAGWGETGRDQFFNNLTVVPEPSSFMLLGLAGIFGLWRFRTRSSTAKIKR